MKDILGKMDAVEATRLILTQPETFAGKVPGEALRRIVSFNQGVACRTAQQASLMPSGGSEAGLHATIETALMHLIGTSDDIRVDGEVRTVRAPCHDASADAHRFRVCVLAQKCFFVFTVSVGDHTLNSRLFCDIALLANKMVDPGGLAFRPTAVSFHEIGRGSEEGSAEFVCSSCIRTFFTLYEVHRYRA